MVSLQRSLLCCVICAFISAPALAQSELTSNASTSTDSDAVATGTTAPAASLSEGLEEVVVSARKREESLLNVPTSITAFSGATLNALNITSTINYAMQTPNLAFSYGSAGLGYAGTRSIAIRGISGEGTTGVYVDDTPVPDWFDPRIVDIDRIEVLKGPQGTLFGEGSLGGNVRLITVQPSDTRDGYFQAGAGATKDGPDADGGVEFAANQALGAGLTARVTGFVDHSSGFITRTWPALNDTASSARDQGASTDYGGSLAFLWNSPLQGLSVTARIMFQNTRDLGWPAPFAPLTCFCVQSYTMDRLANVQDGSNDRWYLPSITINYRADKFTVVSSTSYFNDGVTQLDDSTEGTVWAFFNVYGPPYTNLLNPGQGWTFAGDRRISITTNETRVSFTPTHWFNGIAGVYMSRRDALSTIDDGGTAPGVAALGLTTAPYGSPYCPDGGTTCPSYGSNLVWYSNYPSTRLDEAIFGETYWDWSIFELTVGLRAYRETFHQSFVNQGAENLAYIAENLGQASQTAVVPKFALSAKLTPDTTVYASASKGFRAGGINQLLPPFCQDLASLGLTDLKPSSFKSDSVWDYEVGGKSQFGGGRMLATGSLFYMNWSRIQQEFDVPGCFLGVTLNEGAALARGGEFEFSGRVLDNLDVRAGFGYDDARFSIQSLPVLPPVGARVAIVPLVTWNLSATYNYPLANGYTLFVTPEVNHVGDSTSYNLSPKRPLTRAPYTIANASVGVRWDNSNTVHSELSLYVANLTDQRPNLGDLGELGFPLHSSGAGDAPLLPRVVTLPPLTALLQYRLRF